MSNKNFNQSTLLINYLASSLVEKFHKNTKVKIPREITGYKYIRTLSRNQEGNTAVALYNNKNGKNVVIKIWKGRFKDYSYFALKNEAAVYQTLNETIQRLEGKIPSEFQNLRIPMLIDFIESGESLILIIEWLNAKGLKNFKEEKIIKTYFKVNNFFEYLGKNMTISEKNSISTRSALSYTLLYPLLFLKAIVSNSSSLSNIVKGGLVFVKTLPVLLSNEKISLIHRDLNFENIMISGRNIYVIDLEFCTFTYKAYEFVTTAKYTWNKKFMQKDFFKELIKSYGQKGKNMELIKLMTVIIATHALAANSYSKKWNENMRNFLEFGVNL